MTSIILSPPCILIASLIFSLVAVSVAASGSGPPSAQVAEGPNTAPDAPRRHFRVPDVAALSDDAREKLYRDLIQQLSRGYALSGAPAGRHYPDWRRVNTVPYPSATHGRRFVNNYANDIAAAYRRYEAAGIMPVGSIIAKDSFAVAEDGSVLPGPLFIMEKMQPGFSYVTGDWRYRMIMPDGSLFGTTNGENAARVEFCIGCHLAREKYDHLFFVPREYRRK